MKVIVTKRSRYWVRGIVQGGTKRQRAKYKNAYCVLSVSGRTGAPCPKYCLGKHWTEDCIKGQLRLARAERRVGIATPEFLHDSKHEPMWDGVRGMVGPLWRYHGLTESWYASG